MFKMHILPQFLKIPLHDYKNLLNHSPIVEHSGFPQNLTIKNNIMVKIMCILLHSIFIC